MARLENSTQAAQREGRESRQRVVEFLADAFTDPRNPLDPAQANELKAVGFYFPDLSKPIAAVAERYSDRPDLQQAILLAAAVQLVEKLIDPQPAKPLKAQSATLSVVPK
jgi:hypothetical protein